MASGWSGAIYYVLLDREQLSLSCSRAVHHPPGANGTGKPLDNQMHALHVVCVVLAPID